MQMGLLTQNNVYDLIVIRFASFNQILDPWVYLLFRRELVVRCVTIIRKQFCPEAYKKRNNSIYKYVETTVTTDRMVTLAQTSDVTGSPIISSKVRLANNKLLSDNCPTVKD